MKKIKFFVLSIVAILVFLASQIHSSHAADEEEITLAFGDARKIVYQVNLDRSLSELRADLISEEIMKRKDIFQKNKKEILHKHEKKMKIKEIISNDGKDEDRTIYISRIKENKPNETYSNKEIKAESYINKKEKLEFTLAPELSRDGNNFPAKDMSATTTSGLTDYNDLSQEQRESLFNRLQLTSCIKVGSGTVIRPSFRRSVIWNNPDKRYPPYVVEVTKEYSSSKELHELRKLGITNVTVGIRYLNDGGQLKAESERESLKRNIEQGVYLLVKYRVPKIELSIQKKFIQVSSGLKEEIEEAIEGGKNLRSYKKLIEIFDDYGFCLPIQFIIGGQINYEDNTTHKSQEEAEKTARTIALGVEVKAFSVGGGYQGQDQRRDERVSSLQGITTRAIGGDPATQDDHAQWMASLGPYENWRVIEYSKVTSIIKVLDEELRSKVESFIRQWCTNPVQKITLEWMKQTYREERFPSLYSKALPSQITMGSSQKK